jgi:hypothetical protein
MQHVVVQTVEDQLEKAIEILSTLASWHIMAASVAYPGALANASDMIRNRADALAQDGCPLASERLQRLASEINHCQAA